MGRSTTGLWAAAAIFAVAACDGGDNNNAVSASGATLGGLTSAGDTDSGTDSAASDSNGSGVDTDEGSGDETGEGGPKFDLGSATSGMPPDDQECAAVAEEAELVPLPADIIVVVDNSGSMTFEAGQIQARLNDFSQQIIDSGIDVHVVLISSYPNSGNGICMDPPLGNGGCPNDDNNPPLFTHVNQSVSSHNAWDRVLATHAQWSGAMREESSKHILVVTDDTSNMSLNDFDTGFLGLDPTYADYIQHSVVCHSNCASAAGIGSRYINLSVQTGGVPADLCDQDFQSVFDVLSTEVIGGTQLACEFEIPEPPNGDDFDPDKVNVEFDDGMGGTTSIPRVDNAGQCGAVLDGWYYDDPLAPTMIVMCPQTCETAQDAKNGSITIAFGCETVVPG